MKNIIKLKINEKLSNRMEYLNFAIIAHEQILSTIMLKTSEYEYNTEIYDYYMNEYTNLVAELKMCIKSIIELYKKDLGDIKNYRYRIDFENKVLELESEKGGISNEN